MCYAWFITSRLGLYLKIPKNVLAYCFSPLFCLTTHYGTDEFLVVYISLGVFVTVEELTDLFIG